MHHSREIILIALFAAVAPPSFGRGSGQDQGAAIVPSFSIEDAVLHPGEDVNLLACAWNANSHASRSLKAGDQLTLDFTAGLVGNCDVVPASEREAAFAPGAWRCSTSGQLVTFTYAGAGRTWPLGEMMCARVQYQSPALPVTVVVSAQPVVPGSMAPPLPTVLGLAVDPELGTPGPPGPVGPIGATGPTGATGSSGVGTAMMAESTFVTLTNACNGVVPISGLDVNVSVSAGSRVLVMIAVTSHNRCRPRQLSAGTLDVELDGAVQARMREDDESGGIYGPMDLFFDSTTFPWISDPLGAGPHRVRALLEIGDPWIGCDNNTKCIGDDADDSLRARILVIELKQ
jgi:hypothetical protein